MWLSSKATHAQLPIVNHPMRVNHPLMSPLVDLTSGVRMGLNGWCQYLKLEFLKGFNSMSRIMDNTTMAFDSCLAFALNHWLSSLSLQLFKPLLIMFQCWANKCSCNNDKYWLTLVSSILTPMAFFIASTLSNPSCCSFDGDGKDRKSSADTLQRNKCANRPLNGFAYTYSYCTIAKKFKDDL